MSRTSRPKRPGPSLWHHLKAGARKALDAGYQTGQGFDEALLPWAQCGICREEIVLPGIPPLDTDNQHKKIDMWIMYCGHMYCFDCGLFFWNCEVCRSPERFESPTCGHYAGQFVLPSQFENFKTAPDLQTLIDAIPKTLPEGGSIPARCSECYDNPEEKAYTEMKIEAFARMPYDDEESRGR